MRSIRTCILVCLYGAAVLSIAFACRKSPAIPEIPEDYRNWNLATDTLLNYSIPGHEDHFRRMYINPSGERFNIIQKNGRAYYEFPEGTVIVKEIYAGLEEPASQELPILLTVMMKASEHPESRGGWLWLSQNYETKETHVIDYEYCVDCHANANESHPYGDKNPDNEFRDYVYFPPGQPDSQPQNASSGSEDDGY